MIQRRHGGARGIGELGQRGDPVGARHGTRRQQTFDVCLRRGHCIGDRRDVGHRECTVHGVDGTHQRVVRKGWCGGNPLVDGAQMAANLDFKDLQQYWIDAGRDGVFRRRRLNCGRFNDRLDLGHLHRRDSGFFRDFGDIRRRRDIEDFLAVGDAVGECLHAFEITGDAALAPQRRMQLRQGEERLVDHRHYCGRSRTRAVEHAVQHALDLPAELAQGLGAHEAPAALQGMEHAPDRTQFFQILGCCTPWRKHLVEVVDLFLEFLEEDFADLVVDFVASDFKASGLATADRRGGCSRHRRNRLDRDRRRDFRQTEAVHGIGCGPGAGVVRFKQRLGGFVLPGACNGQWFVIRQRPVAERFEAVAGDVEDVVAVGALFAQRFQVVLDARQRIGKGVELAAVGHAMAPDQFALGIHADAGQVVRRQWQFQHRQRAGDFLQQPWDFREFGVVPAGFDECDERLARVGEVGDRLAHEYVEHLARLARQRVVIGVGIRPADPGHLFVQ